MSYSYDSNYQDKYTGLEYYAQNEDQVLGESVLVKQLQHSINEGEEEEDDEEEFDSEDEDDDEDEELDLEALSVMLQNMQAPLKPNHEAVKNGGRVPQTDYIHQTKKNIITKHDPFLSGVKNAHTLERNMDSGSMQDLRISSPVYNSLKEVTKRQQTSRNRVRGNRVDKSTSEQVKNTTIHP